MAWSHRDAVPDESRQSRKATNPMTPMKTEIVLADMDAWETFAADNCDALIGEYGSIANAYQHAIQGGLTLGGGVAPMFRVSFGEE